MIFFITKTIISYLIFIHFLLPKVQSNTPLHIGLKWSLIASFFSSSLVSIPHDGLEFFARLIISILVVGFLAFFIGFIYGAFRLKKSNAGNFQKSPSMNSLDAPTLMRNASEIKKLIPDFVKEDQMSSSLSIDENRIYSDIANELDSGNVDKGLWVRLYAETDGNEAKTKVLYIKSRAEILFSAEKKRLKLQIQLDGNRALQRNASDDASLINSNDDAIGLASSNQDDSIPFFSHALAIIIMIAFVLIVILLGGQMLVSAVSKA